MLRGPPPPLGDAASCAGSVASSGFGQKIRLNVVALLGDGVVGKMLVPIDEDALMEDLASKIRVSLMKGGISGHLLRLTNTHGAHLPNDERVGDVLRDFEEVIAVMAREPEDLAPRQHIAGQMANVMSISPAEAGAGHQATQPSIKPFKGFTQPGAEPPAIFPTEPPSRSEICPGPSEVLEEDLREAPVAEHRRKLELAQGAVVIKTASNSDWCVEGLTPKLREYVSTRFLELHQAVADPGQSYITVSMQPQTDAVPIHYSVARIDIIEFERLCKSKIQEIRWHIDYFERCKDTLTSMEHNGASLHDYAPNMLPYKYRADDEFGSLLSEADSPAFGQVEGFRPTIVIDTGGRVGENLLFVKEAMKRMLYSFIATKSKFNFVRFNSQGRAEPWVSDPVPPTAEKLREAEEWLERLRPLRANADLVEGLHWALAPVDTDIVYVVTSGFHARASVDYILKSIRANNVRDLPVHVIGIDCEARAELDLRRLAEENSGTFRQKRFDRMLTDVPAPPRVSAWSGGDREDARLTIGGQLSILEIMAKEQSIQKSDWLEEQKCANRLLLSTATQQVVPDAEQARAATRRAALNHFGPRPTNQLQDMLERTAPSSGVTPVAASTRRPPVGPPSGSGIAGAALAAATAAAAASRQQPVGAQSRARSQPRAGAAPQASSVRRPSLLNPWDRPGCPSRTSHCVAASKNLSGSSGSASQPATARGNTQRRATSARRATYAR